MPKQLHMIEPVLVLGDAGFNRPSMSDADIQTLVNGGIVAYDPAIFATGHGRCGNN